jgi:hypothetical protein
MRRILLMTFTVLAAARCAAAPPAPDAVDVPDQADEQRASDHPWLTRFGFPFLAGLTDLGAQFWILFGITGEVDPSGVD